MFERADDVLMEWLNKVNEGDVDRVLSLYDPDAVLLPTFSSEIRSDPDGIKRYFERLTNSDEVAVELDKNSLIIQKLSNNVYSLGGVYSWHFDRGGESDDFTARFTYTVNIHSETPILHHHSSLVPEE